MRRDLVEAVLAAASSALFEDVTYTPVGGVAVIVEKAIFGVEVAADRFDLGGQAMREVTHVTRALAAKFPNLQVGDLLDDGAIYRVVDFEPVGDGRFEIAISLARVD